MIYKTKRYHAVLKLTLFLLPPFLASAGCANGRTAVETAYIQQLTKSSSVHAGKKKYGDAVENLKIVLAIDPDDPGAGESMKPLLLKRDMEAERHLKAGLSVLNSNPQKAKEELLDALRLRRDCREAVAALRELHLASSEASIQARIKKEAKIAAVKAHGREQADEEDVDAGDYSLEIAVSSFEDGDYATAVRQFERMKTRFPNDPDIQMYLDRCWHNIGVAHFAKKDYRKALSSFAKVRRGDGRVDEYMSKCRQGLRNSKSR